MWDRMKKSTVWNHFCDIKRSREKRDKQQAGIEYQSSRKQVSGAYVIKLMNGQVALSHCIIDDDTTLPRCHVANHNCIGTTRWNVWRRNISISQNILDIEVDDESGPQQHTNRGPPSNSHTSSTPIHRQESSSSEIGTSCTSDLYGSSSCTSSLNYCSTPLGKCDYGEVGTCQTKPQTCLDRIMIQYVDVIAIHMIVTVRHKVRVWMFGMKGNVKWAGGRVPMRILVIIMSYTFVNFLQVCMYIGPVKCRSSISFPTNLLTPALIYWYSKHTYGRYVRRISQLAT